MEFDIAKALKKVASLPAEGWVLREVRENIRTLLVRDSRPEAVSLAQVHGVYIEARVEGQFGYAATQDLSDDGIALAAQRALEQAQAASQYKVFPFTEAQRPVAIGEYRSPCKIPFDKLSTEELYSILLRSCEAMKLSDKIVKRDVFANLVETDVRYVSSNGSDVWQHFNIALSGMNVVAKDGTNVQRRTRHGNTAHSYQKGAELYLEPDFESTALHVASQALELLTADECPTETTTLVLAPDQMMLQIHESIGHPLELDRILGDERNYAGFSFVRPSDFGKLKYGSSLMNVTFDPTIATEIATYAFDDCGNKATKEFLIKDGLLVRGLGSLESQARLGLAGVANLRSSSWNRAPIDRMANLNLEPGKHSYDDIIGSIENGVFMETNKSWSIDDYRNKFQFGCEYARRIENGKLTTVLRNPNYRGMTSQFWHNLVKVGDESTVAFYGTPNCGKGEPNQMIRVGHSSPLCAFANVEVFGGAK